MKTFKKIMLATDLILSHETAIGNDYYIKLGIGISNLKFSHSDSGSINVFNNKMFLQAPFSLKKYYHMSKKTSGFIDFGITGNYLIIDKKEYKSSHSDETIKRQRLGYNVGFMGIVGYKIKIKQSFSIDLSIAGFIDIINSYKAETDKIKTNKRMIGVSFYKALGR